MSESIPPRGIRNNNPGNLDRTQPRAGWQGAVPDGQLTDPRFEQFIAPVWGLRALASLVQGIVRQENGRQPYDDDMITQAVEAALPPAIAT